MWWGIGGLAALMYIVLIMALGVTTLREHHWVMFSWESSCPCFGSSAP